MKQQDIYGALVIRLFFFFASLHPVFPQSFSLTSDKLSRCSCRGLGEKTSVALIKKIYAEDSEGRNQSRGEKMKDCEVEVSLDVWWMGEIMLGVFFSIISSIRIGLFLTCIQVKNKLFTSGLHVIIEFIIFFS